MWGTLNKRNKTHQCKISLCSLPSDIISIVYLARHSPWCVLHAGNAERMFRYKHVGYRDLHLTLHAKAFPSPCCRLPAKSRSPSLVFRRVYVGARPRQGLRHSGAPLLWRASRRGGWWCKEILAREVCLRASWGRTRWNRRVILRWSP